VYRLAIEFRLSLRASSPASEACFSRRYAIARDSATECGALVDLLLARGLIGSPLYGEARTLIVRIVQMLTQLGARMATRHASRGDV
jgi:hypothetical protein